MRGAAILIALWPVVATAQGIDLPGNADLRREVVEENGSYDLPVGVWRDGQLPVRTIEGVVTRQAWRIGTPDLATVRIMAPLRAQLVEDGYYIVLDCATDGCGGFDFRFGTQILPPPEMYVDLGDFRFVSAEREGEAGTEAVGIMVSASARAGFVQIVRAGADAGPAVATAQAPVLAPPGVDRADIATVLEAEGHVVLGDLTFETGSAELGPGPYASLAALAEYMRANPDRRIALVGHTDAEGPLDANIALSRRRAGSVLERLATVHGVGRARMEAQGMGYLAPVASNVDEAGREANRRVEAILTSVR